MAERFTDSRASELLSRGHTLNAEFAGILNPVLGSLPDSYPIASLFKIFRRSHYAREALGIKDAPKPPEEWYNIMTAQDDQRQIQMGLLLERITELGLRTVGGIRATFVKPDWRLRPVGPSVGQPFAFLAFKKLDPQVPENLTLGL